MNKEGKRIIFILTAIILLFLSLIIYLTGFQIFKADSIKNNPYNKRTWMKEEEIIRGRILDRKDKVLVHSEKNDSGVGTRRVYDYGNLYSHVTGYSYREYGKSGLELSYDDVLLGDKTDSLMEEIKDVMADEKLGNDIRLSLDHGMQAKSRELLANRKGAIITMNHRTGEVYSMVSYPDYDTDKLRENWETISNSEGSPFLNRATQGLYAPGSTFKMVTAVGVLENLSGNQTYTCEGTTVVDGYTFQDYSKTGHGNMDLKGAFTKSCNTYFINKTMDMGKNKLGKTGDKLFINKEIEFDIPVSKSKFPYDENLEKTEIAASGIGQGRVLMTPLNMLLITSSIANGGDMVKPKLVNEIISPEGTVLESISSKSMGRVMSEENARIMQDMMESVVSSGTGRNAQISGVKVGGKTGTAENASGKSHAWFTGYASDISVVVVLEEDGGTGGSKAAPIARELLNYGINNIN